MKWYPNMQLFPVRHTTFISHLEINSPNYLNVNFIIVSTIITIVASVGLFSYVV